MALPDCQQRNISVEWADVDTDSVPPVAVVVLQRRKLLETDENNLRVGSRDSPRVKLSAGRVLVVAPSRECRIAALAV